MLDSALPLALLQHSVLCTCWHLLTYLSTVCIHMGTRRVIFQGHLQSAAHHFKG